VQGDVMGRVTWRVHDSQRPIAESDQLAGRDASDPFLRAWTHRAEERAHPIQAVGACCARDESLGIDQVSRTDLVHPNRCAWVPLEEGADATGVIHVDVRHDDMCERVWVDAEHV
jgi:hypothetical protein